MQKIQLLRVLNGFACAVLVLLPLSVAAGGLEFPDLGTTAIGRGTAMAARADDPSAFYYNPAGLSKQTGFYYLLGANLVLQNVTFTRAGSGEEIPVSDNLVKLDPELDYSAGAAGGVPYEPVLSESKMGPAPMLVLGYGFELPKEQVLGVSLGLLTPSAFGAPQFPKDGPQRYVLTEANFLLAYPGVGVTYAWNKYLRLGAVFLSGFAVLHQSQAVRLQPMSRDADYNEDAGGDAYMKVEATDGFIPTAIFGLLSQPLEWLEVGASLKLPAKVEADGTIALTPPTDDFSKSVLIDGMNKLSLAQQFPLVARVGARFVHRRLDVEADFVWENWSSLKGFEVDTTASVRLIDGSDESHGKADLPDTRIPKNFRDTFSVRLGSDVDVWPQHLTLRLGGYYQSSAYPEDNSTFSVDFPYGQQIGLGGGLTWSALNWLDVVVGYLHVFQPDVTVKDGEVQQMGPLVEDNGKQVNVGNVINNGKYELSLNVVGLTLQGHF